MRNEKLKQIKEVNGWKVNHPHSASNIVYAIFSIIFTALPLVYLFIPVFSLEKFDFANGATGLDAFKVLINFFKNISVMFTNGQMNASLLFTAEVNPYLQGMVLAQAANMQQASIYIILAMGGLIALSMAFALVCFIMGLVHIIKGNLKRSGTVKVFSSLQFVTALLYVGCALFFYFTIREHAKKELFIWLGFAPAGVAFIFMLIFSIMHHAFFAERILEKDLVLDTSTETSEAPVSKPEAVKEESSNSELGQGATLPAGITSIGGHSFAENQNLIIANIPIEVTKLGPSAFANCLNLQIVSIPKTVTEIGYNCFFNCVELERINYSGTKIEWKKVKRGSNWLTKAKTNEVVCSDGIVIVNPYH